MLGKAFLCNALIVAVDGDGDGEIEEVIARIRQSQGMCVLQKHHL